MAAAQDGASSAASGGPQAGISRATAILAAAGGTGAALHATAIETDDQVTVTVQGDPPKLFSLPLILPGDQRLGQPAARAVPNRRTGSHTMNLTRRFADEDGQGIVSALLLLAGVLLPLMFLVALFGRIEQGRLAADQTAQDAVRAASLAPTQAAAVAGRPSRRRRKPAASKPASRSTRTSKATSSAAPH